MCSKHVLFQVLIVFFISCSLRAQLPSEQTLARLPGLKLEELPPAPGFPERYLLWVRQPLDHGDTAQGFFWQRVILSLRPSPSPVLFVTEGYSAEYALSGSYTYELSDSLPAHQLVVEHRFFAPSAPQRPTLPWEYLTVAQAAADHHRIIRLLRPLFPAPWVSTGISKGGQAALFHRSLYPHDVEATVGYVCPLNFSTEDRRVYDFLDQVGEQECREAVRAFQRRLLAGGSRLVAEFRRQARKQRLTYAMGWDAAYELLVLEYSFAFWQWGFSCASIPPQDASPGRLIAHLDSVSSLDWVSRENFGNDPFIYQALTEIGMYGYDTTYLPGLVHHLKSTTFDFACPEGWTCTFDPRVMQRVQHYLETEAENILLIYGEYDPWSATAVDCPGNTDVRVYYAPGGSHTVRIPDLAPDDRREAMRWLRWRMAIPGSSGN
ncbi:MAG TPA: S28 family serine protease [Bacteroidales bacterium]|nr:S28 family serine protease [Bacteroidales bacterium]